MSIVHTCSLKLSSRHGHKLHRPISSPEINQRLVVQSSSPGDEYQKVLMFDASRIRVQPKAVVQRCYTKVGSKNPVKFTGN